MIGDFRCFNGISLQVLTSGITNWTEQITLHSGCVASWVPEIKGGINNELGIVLSLSGSASCQCKCALVGVIFFLFGSHASLLCILWFVRRGASLRVGSS